MKMISAFNPKMREIAGQSWILTKSQSGDAQKQFIAVKSCIQPWKVGYSRRKQYMAAESSIQPSKVLYSGQKMIKTKVYNRTPRKNIV